MPPKRLVHVGNSLAVIIEKPILRVLGLGPRAVLRMWTDGKRIVIEPTGELVPSRTSAPKAVSPYGTTDRFALERRAVYVELERHYGLGPHHLDQLTHVPMRFVWYPSWARDLDLESATPAERATLQRMEHCRDRLREGDGWDAAIASALQAFPKE